MGPAFAVLGSLGAQLLFNGSLFNWVAPAWLAIAYPYNYALLFSVGAIGMTLAAFLVNLYQIPLPEIEVKRESFSAGLVGGFKAFLGHRILLIASLAYLLVYCGNMVQINMSLFTQEAVGRLSEELTGYQLGLRFSFKMLCGFFWAGCWCAPILKSPCWSPSACRWPVSSGCSLSQATGSSWPLASTGPANFSGYII